MKKFVVKFLTNFFNRYPKTFIFIVLLYIVWPYDFLPEGILGPFGYVEDILVGVIPIFIYRYFKNRKKPSSTL